MIKSSAIKHIDIVAQLSYIFKITIAVRSAKSGFAGGALRCSAEYV
jgi:hypothetical protein